MTLEERIKNIRDNYPDSMTQLQFGEAVGLSKSSTCKIVREGRIPYEHVCDRLIHYHIFKKEDVISFLKETYPHTSESHIKAGKHCIAMILKDEPDVLTMKDVMRITGLWKSAVQKWVLTGKMRGFDYYNSKIVLKNDLIDFMASPAYQDSSHRNIRAEAVAMAVEWYRNVSNSVKGGMDHGD